MSENTIEVEADTELVIQVRLVERRHVNKGKGYGIQKTLFTRYLGTVDDEVLGQLFIEELDRVEAVL